MKRFRVCFKSTASPFDTYQLLSIDIFVMALSKSEARKRAALSFGTSNLWEFDYVVESY